MNATQHPPRRKTVKKTHPATPRPVPELLLELAYQLHVTKVVNRPATSGHLLRSSHQARHLLLTTIAGPINPALGYDHSRRDIMADTIREKIEDAGQAAKDATKKAGKKIKEGAETVAEKAGNAAHSAGQAVKDAGQKLKDKSGA